MSTTARRAFAMPGSSRIPPAQPPTLPDWPSARQAWGTATTLAACSALGAFDRAIISLVGEPLRRDLGISDAQFGIIAGLAFAIPLALLAIPAGRLGDRTNRKSVLLAGLTLWSTMTAVCGAAKSTMALVAARIGLGSGEATITPSAIPMLADSFPVARRSRPTSLFFLGLHVGQAAAFVIGGALLARLERLAPVTLPLVGTVFAWQLLFPIAGAAGLIVMVLVIAMREPQRRERLRFEGNEPKLAARDVARFVWHRASAFSTILIAPMLLALGSYALIVFLPSLFQRAHGWPVDRTGAVLGAVGLPAAILGTLLAGVLGDRLMRYRWRGGHARLLAWTILAGAAFAVAVPLSPTGPLAAAALGVTLLCFSLGLALPSMAIQVVAPNEMRGQLVGATVMLTNLFGFGLGPVIAGELSDLLGNLPRALALLLAVSYPLAGIVALAGARFYDRLTVEAAALRAPAS